MGDEVDEEKLRAALAAVRLSLDRLAESRLDTNRSGMLGAARKNLRVAEDLLCQAESVECPRCYGRGRLYMPTGPAEYVSYPALICPECRGKEEN